MKQLDKLWTEVQPLLSRLSPEEQEKITAAFDLACKNASNPESKYRHAIKDREGIYAQLKKSSENLVQRYQTLFENSGTAMIVIENDGTISLTNALFLSLIGCRREDVENRINFFEIFDERFRNQVQDYHRRRRAGDTTVPHHYEAQIITSEGKTLDVIIMIGLFLETDESVVSIIDITERKRLEEDLGFFKTSAERAYDEIFWLDFEGNIFYVNDAACQKTGYSQEELLSMKVFKLDPDFNPAVWKGFTENLRKTGHLLFETRHKLKDGSIMDVEIATNYVNRDGREYSFAYVRDITERKHAEEELAYSKEYLAQIFSSIKSGILIIDAKTHEIVDANPAAAEIIGQDKKEIIGKTCHQCICPSELGHCPITDLNQTVDNAQRILITADGKRVPIIKHVIRVNMHGRECLLETFIDNTGRKQTEQALRQKNEELNTAYNKIRESEARFRAIFDQSQDALFLFDESGSFDCNSRVLKLFGGASREEFLTLNPMVLSPQCQPDGQESLTAALDHLAKAREKGVDHYEWVYWTLDCREFPAEVFLSAFDLAGIPVVLASIRDITERKRMEEDLRLFKISAERASDEIFWFDFEGNMLYVNDAACQKTGYSREELLSMKVFKLYPDFNPKIWERFTEDLRRTEHLLFETRHQRKDGSIMNIEIATNYVKKDEREYSFAYVRDITERIRMQDDLMLLKTSVDSGYDEVFWMDMEGNVLYVNQAASRTTGYSPEELYSMKIYALEPDFTPGIWEKSIEDLRKNKKQFFTTRHKRKDGVILNVEISSVYVTKGDKEYAFCFVHDITERIRTEAELSAAHEQLIATEQELRANFDRLASSRALLEESEARFHGVFNNANDGIFMHLLKDDVPDRFLEVNEAMCRALGYTREELLSMTVKDILSEAQLKKMPEIGKKMTESGYHTFNAEYRRKDGSTAPVEVNSRVYQFSGQVVVLSVARDITERKRAEQDLLKKNDELNAAYEQLAAVEQELRANYENLSTTEKKLRESEAWSREFTEFLPQFVYEIDTTGRLLYVNKYAIDTFGITRETLEAGLNFRDFIVPEEWEIVEKNLLQILAGKKTTHEIYHIRRNDGTLMPVNMFTAPVYRDRVLTGFRGIGVDITENLEIQESLQKSETRFRELAELLPQIVFELDENLKFTFFNWNTIEMTGYGYDTLSQNRTGINDILQKSDRQPAERFFAHILKDSTSGHLGCVIITQDGKEIPAIIYASPIINENRVAGVRGVIVDIGEQKLLESALRESETRFRELAELIPQFIFETDRNFRFTYSNLGAMMVTGYSSDDFSKKIDAFSIVDIAGRPQIRELFQRLLGGQDVPPLQFLLLKKDGTKLPVTMYASTIVKGNEYAGIRGIIVDIADQKRLEKALATTNQKLNMMNSLTRHDVLNNITGLLGLVDMLGELTTDSNAQNMISEIHGLIITIKDQIVFTRDYQSVGVKIPQWQSLRQGIQYAASTIRLDDVHLKMPESDAEIYADPFFGRVFYNLIDNSLRHGGSIRNIVIDTEIGDNNSLVIRYRDDGIGVPPDEKDRIFEQGYGKNTGFGLFIIREILGITGMTIRETGMFRSGAQFEIAVPQDVWRVRSANGCGEHDSK